MKTASQLFPVRGSAQDGERAPVLRIALLGFARVSRVAMVV